MQKKQGISLIVLVITIIVMIILAASVVITLSNNGIIDKANHAVNTTTTKQVEQLANVIWAEAYADKFRGSDLEREVFSRLEENGIDPEEWGITVTDKGVAFGEKNASIYPIIWNSMDVMENSSFTISGMPFVKISEHIPTKEEILSLKITVEAEGEVSDTICDEVQEINGLVVAISNDAPLFIIVQNVGEYSELGINISETGLYVLNYGAANVNATFIIEKTIATPTITLINKKLTINPVAGAKKYEVYINNELKVITQNVDVEMNEWLKDNNNCLIYVRAIGERDSIVSEYTCATYVTTELEPGLYETGSVKLYKTGGKEAIKDKLVMSWAEMIKEGIVDFEGQLTENYRDIPNKNDLILPYGLTKINEEAFFCGTASIGKMTGLIIPDSVVTIGEKAFGQCSGITDIIIGKNVKSISSNAFCYSYNIEEILVDENNQNYCSVDGVLYTKDMSKLMVYPAKKTTTSYVIPNGVKSIDKEAFYYSKTIKSVTIPSTVLNIGDIAFGACTALNQIIYNGTIEQWNQIKLVTNWKSGTKVTKIECINGNVVL